MKAQWQWSMLRTNVRAALAAILAAALMLNGWTGVARGAEETVTGIELDYESSDYNSGTSSLEMFVEDDKVNVYVFASLAGSSSRKEVTNEATWKTSNSSIVKVDKGVLTGVGQGTATISATYKGFTASIKASSSFIYDEIVLMDGDEAAPAAINDIKLGESLVFSLLGIKNGSSTSIASEAVWTTSNSSVAKVDEGRITLVGAGTATITAKYKGKSDAVKLTVTSPYKSIAIEPAPAGGTLELEVGTDPTPLTAIAVPKEASGNEDVTGHAVWTSGNTKLMTVEKGVVTAVAPGRTKLTVSYLGVTRTIDVVVRTPYQFMKLSPEKEYHMQVQDAPLQIQAEVLNNANVVSNVTTVAEWSTSDALVATVSNGRVTPKAAGTTKITASHKGISRSIDITVYPSITKLAVDSATLDGFKGISGDLPKVTATTFDGSKIDVSKLAQWTVEDEAVASVENGKWTAKALGETKLTAVVQGIEAQTTLIVHVKPIKLIAESKDMSIVLGRNSALPQVTVVNENGEEEDVSSSIAWKANSDNIVLMEKTMRGLEASSVTLTGTYLTRTVTVRVKIEEEIVKLVATPAALELNPGRTKSVKVTGHYKSGKTVSLGSKMNWTISNTKVATLSGSSSVKAVDVGTAKLTGTYQGQKVEIAVVVTPKLKSLQLSDKSIQLSPGASFTVKLQANYTTGNPVDRTNSAVWTTSRASVATVTGGKITAVGKGTATIKATFEGKSVTMRVTVK